MSSTVELGKGIQSAATVNLFDIAPCDPHCIYLRSLHLPEAIHQPDPFCVRNNGDAVIVFPAGADKYTTSEVRKQAMCIKK